LTAPRPNPILISVTAPSVKSRRGTGAASGSRAKRPRGRPRDAALQQRRREQILAEATAVFAEHGYPGTDVQFIADPLGISKGTVYRYFPTKEELFLAAVERGVLRLKEHMERRVETVADPVERIAVAIRSHLEFFRSDPQLVELFIQERAEFRDQRQPIYFEHGEANCGRWRDLIRDLIAAGRVRPVPVERVMNVIGDLMYGTMFKNHLTNRQIPFGEQASDLVDIVFNGILTSGEQKRRGDCDRPRGRPAAHGKNGHNGNSNGHARHG
jgi:AcrR family transcriptional regulator